MPVKIISIIMLLINMLMASPINDASVNPTEIFDYGIYAKTAIVESLNRETDVVTVVDTRGDVWEFSGVEDLCEGDMLSMVMCDMGTSECFDDTILSVRYSGTGNFY